MSGDLALFRGHRIRMGYAGGVWTIETEDNQAIGLIERCRLSRSYSEPNLFISSVSSEPNGFYEHLDLLMRQRQKGLSK